MYSTGNISVSFNRNQVSESQMIPSLKFKKFAQVWIIPWIKLNLDIRPKLEYKVSKLYSYETQNSLLSPTYYHSYVWLWTDNVILYRVSANWLLVFPHRTAAIATLIAAWLEPAYKYTALAGRGLAGDWRWPSFIKHNFYIRLIDQLFTEVVR